MDRLLTLRPDQLTALAAAAVGNFEAQMIAFARQAFPEQTAACADEDMRTIVRTATRRANAYGFRTGFEIQGFLALTLALGDDFDTGDRFPWATLFLTEAGVEPQQRMMNLVERARIACEEGDV